MEAVLIASDQPRKASLKREYNKYGALWVFGWKVRVMLSEPG
jgi:hypothetical protein